ncbi:hypothetical protein [Chengkuizengella axinellae]|uniref:Uncharacterized protein n=1 Tax=Chengkuizengella axinellae TaxID=3064388 RepID=A0ABT9IXR4_9BACL|nr:hypothetical protein [Chengkuizengella sp. 2205SS18-9]MDP5274141.1 hypothetical protein [Chengkuizengella sp. 2205SS18-9]
MKRKDELDLKEFEDPELMKMLDEYTIEYPNSAQVNHTVDVLRTYVPEKTKKKSFFQIYGELLRFSFKETLFISKTFWLLNLAFFIIGFLSTYNAFTAETGIYNNQPYASVMLLSPIPFILGLIEVFRGRDSNMLELEQTFKYTGQQLMFSKMFMVGTYNLFLSVSLIALLQLFFSEHIMLVKLFLYWIIPFTFVSSIGLFITMKFKNNFAAPIIMLVWISFAISYSMTPNIINYFESIHFTFYLLLMAVSIFFFANQIKKTSKDEMFFEVN